MTSSRKVGNRFGYSKKETKEKLGGGNNLEKLLNKLVEKGWKPRGIYTSLIGGYGLVRCEEYVGSPNNERKSYRELVSKESGLWQFCVKNDLVDYSNIRAYGISFAPIEIQNYGEMQNYDNIHRLLWDCASLDESELEQFLLDNIKI